LILTKISLVSLVFIVFSGIFLSSQYFSDRQAFAAIRVCQTLISSGGTNENDEMRGSNGVDIMDGFGGNDNMTGGDGNDEISGGEGHDILNGGTGDNIMTGDEGNDNIFGGDGNDRIDGGRGADQISGALGNDIIGHSGRAFWPDHSKDTIDCGPGIDTVYISPQDEDYAVSCERIINYFIEG
jgi:Ca2+-binding RTX toxin-like protein